MTNAMPTNIFQNYAPFYWQHNLPVIPLYREEKRPIPQGWQQYHDTPVPNDVQQQWLRSFPQSNLGLVLGKQSGVMAFDIDSTDPNIIFMLESMLPPSPWMRVGKKGKVIAFRYNGLKTFRIKTTQGETICELLSDKTQVVLPPSIHPDTKLPYQSNCNLWEVVNSLPTLPMDIEETIRRALTTKGVELSHSGWTKVTEFVSAGSRDTAITEKAGLFAMGVVRGERTFLEALGMLESSMAEDMLQQVAGDPIDLQKHRQNLVRFLRRDVMEKKKVLPEGWDSGLSQEDKVKYGVDFSRDLEEWSYREIEAHMTDVFKRDVTKGTQDALPEIEKMLAKIANSKNLTPLEVERILNFMSKGSDLGLKPSSLARQIREIKQGDGIKGLDHTELATALIKEIETFYPIRHHMGDFWKYAGSHWEKVSKQWLTRKISQNFGHLTAAKKFGDIEGIIKLTRTLVPEGLTDFQTQVRGVNFANGYLTPDLKLLAHSPEFGLTYTLPFRYFDKPISLIKDAPVFSAFLEASWGDDKDYKDKVLALQEAFAVTLFGLGSKFQRVILLHGVPKSGKSQMLKIASSLVPESARSAVKPEDWSDRFLPSTMSEKLINIAGELSEVRKIDGQSFKDIVDGSELSGQAKFGQPFTFRIIATHWFASNHYPKTTDSSEGFARRWLILNFTKPVSAANRKLDLGDLIIAEEREVIASWAVKAIPRLMERNDFTLPSSHRTIVSEMSVTNNLVLRFLLEAGVVEICEESKKVSEEALYAAFWGWSMSASPLKPMSQSAFREKMREIGASYGFSVEKDSGNANHASYSYHGLKLLSN